MSSSTIFTNPTATSGSDGGNNVMAQRGANYFFGFLITFVVLFLIFVGCGIGSRRRLLAERREAGLLTEWGTPWSDVDQKRPAFHEFALGVPVRVDQWEYIMVSWNHCLKHQKFGLNHHVLLWPWCSSDVVDIFLCSRCLQCYGDIHPKSLRTRKLVLIRGRIPLHALISKPLVVGPCRPTTSFPDFLSHIGGQHGVTTRNLQSQTKKQTSCLKK